MGAQTPELPAKAGRETPVSRHKGAGESNRIPEQGEGEGVKRILVACEFSGAVRDDFAARGWDAWSCDLLPAETPGNHHHGDVREILSQPWDMIIAHPECTYITNSGVRWLDRDIGRWKQMWKACEFFNLFLDHPCPRICVENPIPHKYAAAWLRRKYTHTVQPWMFGHTEIKATCLWLKGLPALRATDDVKAAAMALPYAERAKVHYASPGPDRWKERSRTYAGIAAAMAQQWGET